MAVEAKLLHTRGARPAGGAAVDVISVQSQVAYGHAGNSAAVGPMRQLGVRVVEVPTTLFSNAPVYPTTRGRVLPADWVADLLLGIDERGVPARARMLLSGYLGTVGTGIALADWVDRVLPRHPQLRYCLDPVLGDLRIGMYVESGLLDVVRDRLLPHAWMLTLNPFELAQLSGQACATEAACLAAARALLHGGVAWVVVHGIGLADGELGVLVVGPTASHRLCAPRLAIDVTGTGDVFAGLVVAFLLRGEPMVRAVERATAGVHDALEHSLQAQVEELEVGFAAAAALVEAPRFAAVRSG